MFDNALNMNMLRLAREVNSNPAQRGVLSTGQRAAMALALNQSDWLEEMGYTLAEAVNRLDRAELNAVIFVDRHLHDDSIA